MTHLALGRKKDFSFAINIPLGGQESYYGLDSSARWFLEAKMDVKGRRNITSTPYEVQVVKPKEDMRKIEIIREKEIVERLLRFVVTTVEL